MHSRTNNENHHHYNSDDRCYDWVHKKSLFSMENGLENIPVL